MRQPVSSTIGRFETLEERVVMAAYDLFNFAKTVAPRVSPLTQNVYAEADSQPWAKGPGGSTSVFVTEQPVRFNQGNPSDVLRPAQLYAPAGASYSAPDNKVFVENGLVYLLPNMSEADMTKTFESLIDVRVPLRTLGVAPIADNYDPYTDLVINKNSLPPNLSANRYLAARPTQSNRQVLDLRNIPTYRFNLYWGNSISTEITKDATAEEVENALNQLPSLRNVGGFVTVADLDSAEGRGSNPGTFIVTFGGGSWFNPEPVQLYISRIRTDVTISSPAKSLLLSTQNSGTVTVDLASSKVAISNGFASPLYNVESFIPTEVDYSSTYYPSHNGKTLGTRVMKGLIETSAVAGQFRSTSNFNAVESLLGYRVVDIGSEYQLQPVIDPSGNPQPISAFQLNGLNFELKGGTPFLLKSFDKAQSELYFDSKNSSVEATAEFEGGSLTIRIEGGNNQPAMRVNLRQRTVDISRFISFVSAEIGGVKFTSADGVSFGTDTINSQFVIGLNNFTTTPDALTGIALSESFENLTQILTPQSDRGIFSAEVFNEQGVAPVYRLAQKKSVPFLFTTRLIDDPNGLIDRAAFATNLQSELRRFVSAAANMLPSAITRLTVEERQAIASKITVEYQPNAVGSRFGQYLVRGLPARLQLSINNTVQPKEYRGVAASPVQFTVPSMTITIANGVLQPIENVSVSSVQIGEARVDNAGQYVTTFETIELGAGSDLKLKYYPRYSFDPQTGAEVPGNTFGFYGAQVKLALRVQGATIGGTASTASLGTVTAPGLQVLNGQFHLLTVPVPEVTVDNLKFTTTSFDGFRGLTLNRRPRFGDVPRTYTVEGAATLKGGVGLIKTDLDVLFGEDGTKGLQLFPDSNSYSTSFGIRKGFLVGAGMQLLSRGLYVEQDPTTRKLLLKGTAILEYNNFRPQQIAGYDGRKPSLVGNIVSARLDLPYATSIAANTLDGTSLNVFVTDFEQGVTNQLPSLRINGVSIEGRHPSQNPLRVTVTGSNETFQGAFVAPLGASELRGVVEPFTSIGGVFPTPNVIANFGDLPGEENGFVAAGVTLSGGGRQVLNERLTLNYSKASLDGAVIAEGTASSPVASFQLSGRHLVKAEVTSATTRVVGDVQFSRYTATYDPKVVPTQWQFVGAGTYAGRQVTVGPAASDGINVTIGGDARSGLQLRTVDRLAEIPPTPDFPAPPSIKVAGLQFDLSKLNLKSTLLSSDSKTYTYAAPDFRVKLGGTELQLTLEMAVRVSITGAQVASFSGTVKQNSEIRLGSATLKVTSLSVAYDLGEKALKINGSATFGFKAGKNGVQMTVTLGSATSDGLVIKDGAIDSFLATVDGRFEILKLSAQARGLTIGYDKAKAEFVIYGAVVLSTPMQGGVQVLKNLEVSLGNSKTPGIVIEGGSLKSLNFKINGEINLFKITATPEDLEVSYDAAENELRITGKLTVTLAPKLTLTAGLPGDGLVINTETGKVEVRGLSLESAEDIKFGVLNIHGLHVDYQEEANGDVTISAAAELKLPSGLSVGADFKIINGKLDTIGIVFEKNPGILVAQGLINIFRIEARVEGLSDLANFKLTGSVTASVGPLVKFGRKSFALATVQGTIEITPESLTIKGDVKLVGGQLGNGSFTGTLKWSGTPSVTFNATVELARGVARGSISASIDLKGNIDFKATLGVYVPKGVPIAGNKSLGNLSVELRVRPAEPPSASYVRFAFNNIAVTPFGIPTIFGSARIDFDRNVGFEFGARFFIKLPWPLKNINKRVSVRGNFKLFDGERPEIEILAAAGLPGSPHGQIVFNTMTAYPAGTTIDLYADHDNLGNDGLLIAGGIPYQQGSQIFEWKDMTTFAAPGEPVYVYAVVSDSKHARVYSDYSPRFDVSPGFVPSLNHPLSVTSSFGQPIEFSTTLSRPIVVGDPRSSHDPESRLEVTLSAGQGTLALSRVIDGLIDDGQATDTLKLIGTVADINAALEGLRYEQQSSLNVESDKIQISVRALPLELAPSVTGTIDVKFESVLLGVDGFLNSLNLPGLQSSSLDTITIVAGQDDQTPLDRLSIGDLSTQFVSGARVTINGFEAGQEFLELPMNVAVANGIHGSFDHETGVLSLTGTARLADYEVALSEVIFDTMSVANGKSLSLNLIDHEGDRGVIVVPLDVVAAPPQPSLQVGSNGQLYVADGAPLSIATTPTITVPTGATIQTLQVAINDGYVKDEDYLSFSDSDFNPSFGSDITSSFDPDLGILTLTGTATNDVWREALGQIHYYSVGGLLPDVPLTVGPRTLYVVATDDVGNELEDFVVINVTDTPEPLPVAELTLSTRNRRLEPDVELLPVDPDLTLTHDAAPLVRATVTIVDGHVPGVWELAVGTSLQNLDADFDPLTGVLTITGPASAIDYETILRSVSLLSLEGHRDNTNVAIVFSVTDGMNSAETDPLNVRVVAAPFLAATLDNVVSYQHGREKIRVHDGFVLDFDSTVTGAVVSITEGYHPDQDELLFTPQPGISGSFDTTTGTLTLSGRATVAKYQRILDSIGYRNSRFNPAAGDRVISYQVLRGGLESNVINAIVAVEPETVPPQVDIGPTAAFTEDGSAVALVPNVSITSRDATASFGAAPDMLYAVELDVVNWIAGEDELTVTGTEAISASYDASIGRVVFNGSGTFDEYEAILRGITYRNRSQAPTTTPRTVNIRVQESGLHGMQNLTLSTQTIVAAPDPVSVTTGAVEPINVLMNASGGSLGLDDLQFASSALSDTSAELRFIPTQLPDEMLGQVVLTDGAPVEVDVPYPISQLGDLRFEPTEGGMGTATFSYSVVVYDAATGHSESEGFSQSVNVDIEGVVTSTIEQAFAAQIYRALLERNPDSATLADLSSRVSLALSKVGRENGFNTDTDARASVINELVSSDYRETAINSLYQDLLGRDPTTDELASTATTAELQRDLLISSEYFFLHNADGFTSYVAAVYLDLFDRDASDTEITNGVDQLTDNSSRADFVDSLSPLTISNNDRDALFLELVNREPTFRESLSLAGLSREELLAAILSTDDYFVRYSIPTNSPRIRTQVTNGFESVGTVGDITGGHATGTLIAPQFVLVAAHTVAETPPGQVTFMLGGQTYYMERVFVHPNYDPAQTDSDAANDIAILKLREPVTTITPSRLSGRAPKLGDILNLVGFGQEKGAVFGTKREGSTPPVFDVGQNVFHWQHLSPIQNDSDPGDSGAPLFATINGEQQIIGIVSGGTSDSDLLGEIGTNTRVDSYLDWIQSLTGNLNVTNEADAPSLIFETDRLVIDENSGEHRVAFLTNTAPGLTFSVTTNRPTFFKTLFIDQDGRPDGDLVFEPDLNRRGSAKVFATVTSGNLSVTRMLTVVSAERNDAPTIDPIEELVLPRGPAGASTTQTTLLTGISPGTGETGDVRVRLADVTPSNFFESISLNLTTDQKAAALSFTPAATATGFVQLTVEVSDFDSSGNIARTTTQQIKLQLTDAPLTGRVIDGELTLEAAADSAVDWLLDSDPALEQPNGSAGISLTSNPSSATPVTINLQSVIREITALLSPLADSVDARGVNVPLTAIGYKGNDTLIGGSGDDLLLGGAGQDQLGGSLGNDRLMGQGGVDTLDGGAGIDDLNGGVSATAISDEVAGELTLSNTGYTSSRGDRAIATAITQATLFGSDGPDAISTIGFTSGLATIYGGAGNDTLRGGGTRDTFYGEDGDDILNGGGNRDSLYGGAGNDTINGVGASDLLSGGTGDDFIIGGETNSTLFESVDGAITVSTDSKGVVTMTGVGNDTIRGHFNAVQLEGGDGNDLLDARNFLGQTTLRGGAGNDTLLGSSFADLLLGQSGNDSVQGNAGRDTLDGGNNSDTLDGGAGHADEIRYDLLDTVLTDNLDLLTLI